MYVLLYMFLYKTLFFIEMEAVFNRAINVIQCGGLEMFNVTFKSVNLLKNLQDNQIMKKCQFVPYSNIELQVLIHLFTIFPICILFK